MLLWVMRFSPENLFIENLARLAEQRGQWEKHLQLHPFPIQESGGKLIWNIEPKFQIYQRTLHSLPENAGIGIFDTCILHSYLRGQGVSLSDMGSTANDQINLTKMPKQVGGVNWSADEVRDKFQQTVNSPSGFVSWQNERVQCYANLQYSVPLPILSLYTLFDTSYKISHLCTNSINFSSNSEDKNRQHSWQTNTRSLVEVT